MLAVEHSPEVGSSEPRIPTKRWITTAKSAQDYILSQRHLLGDRKTIAKQLKEQKRNNTKTNLVFGFDGVDYETDAMTRQKDILRGGQYDPNRKQQLAEMKKELQRTNFSFGHDDPDYAPVSTLPDPTGHVHEYTGRLNTEVKRLIKQSNVHLGSDKPEYVSNQTEAFQYRGGPPVDFEKRKREIAALKRELTSTNFNLGNDDIAYSSMYQETFNTGNVEGMSYEDKMAARRRSQQIKQDLRVCHYSLGYDPVDYRTTMMRQFEMPDMEKNAQDRKAYLENARVLKASLVASSLCLGNDDEYM